MFDNPNTALLLMGYLSFMLAQRYDLVTTKRIQYSARFHVNANKTV